MEQAFTLAHAFTARWEGGYVNHPNDPGGATNYGISLRWLRSEGLDINDDGVVDGNDIRALTPDMAASLYQKYFWAEPGICRLPALVAVAVYDGAGNTGIGRAIRLMQEVSNALEGGFLRSDGVIGPLTVSRIKSLCRNQVTQLQFCDHVIRKRINYHTRLGKSARFASFIAGWLNRCHALSGYVHQIADRGWV